MRRVVAKWTIAIAVLALGAGLPAAAPVSAQPSSPSAAEPEPLLRQPPRHARPKVRVRPLYPYRRYHTDYPPPYDIEYPGPNAVRQCVNRYVREHRPSGTVLVPRMRCWWARR